LFVFYFANGGYIIRIRPIAKGILVVPKEELMKSPLKGRSSNGNLLPWQGISRGLNNYRETFFFLAGVQLVADIIIFLRIHRKV
jgi:hypothetical protein